MLYHLLPVVIWLLAIGGSILAELFIPALQENGWSRVTHYIPTLSVLICIAILGRIERHTSSVEECFQASVLLGIAAYWLPTIVFLIIPMWGYLYWRNLFSSRSLSASLIGFALVAVWAFVLHHFAIISLLSSFLGNAWLWIPTGILLFAWLASTIARQILRVR